MFKQSLNILRLSERFMCKLKPREFCSGSCLYKVLVIPERRNSPFQHCIKVNSFHLSSESLSKNRDKKRDKKKIVRINENELGEYFEIDKLMADLARPLEIFREELVRHTTLRSAAGAVENLKVQFEDNMYTIQDLAQVGKKNPRLIVLDFSAVPRAIPAVLQTFQKSELNINAQQDGTKVFVPLPRVTKDHREFLAKKCKLYFVKCKEGIRDVQMKYIKKLGSVEKLSVEEKFRLTDQLTALGDRQIQIAEGIMKEKQEDLLKVEDMA